MAYTGLIAEIPLAQRGLVSPIVAMQNEVGALIDATNVSYQRGSLQKELGAKRYNLTNLSGSPTILGGVDWWADPVTRRIALYLSTGNVVMDTFPTGSFSTTVGTGFSTLVENVIWLEAGQETAGAPKKTILINGIDLPVYISGTGTTFSSFTSTPADWTPGHRPVAGIIHEGRAWYAMGHRLYYSTVSDHTDVDGTGSGVFVVFPGEGREIRGLLSYKGLLLVFKHPVGVYAIDTSSPDVSHWTVSRITGAVGVAGPRSVCAIDNDVLFLDPSGDYHLLSAVQGYGDVAPRPISKETFLRDVLLQRFNYNYVHRTQLIYDPQWNQVHTTWVLFGELNVYGRLVVDLSLRDVARFRFVDRDDLASMWVGRSTSGAPTLYGGSTDGVVWELNHPELAKQGEAYSATAEIAPTDLGYLDPMIAAKRKNGDFLELVADSSESQIVVVEILWDNRPVQTVTFSFGSGGSALGSFVFGTSTLAGFGGRSVKRRITGSGTRFSFRVRNGMAYQNFSLVKAFLYFRVADEKK